MAEMSGGRSADNDARPGLCGCRIYDVGEPYICPTHWKPPRIIPPAATEEER